MIVDLRTSQQKLKAIVLYDGEQGIGKKIIHISIRIEKQAF